MDLNASELDYTDSLAGKLRSPAAFQVASIVFTSTFTLSVFLFTLYLTILHIELGRRGMTTIEYSRYLVEKDELRAQSATVAHARDQQQHTWIALIAERFWCWGKQRANSKHVGKQPSRASLKVWPVGDQVDDGVGVVA
ncbi:hypothetical protein BCR44DRAFT_1495622 [Catenaria anguillulae PL171]|uniref:Uncharacterized protein n=1 Tax=Catenaria anguillulae PL171 TaxID=765915 RepID=A0A1Y2I2K2_9FUNG|nr:hypothetical protein BCR44DRAFT_1495622 [Catenaria anguillulae PL171]